jgi:glutamine synthetase
MSGATGHLSVEALAHHVERGEIDTVLLAVADMQGRLQGKRFHAGHFVDFVVAHSAEACNYLLAVDVDMNTVGGYSLSSWEGGYGDFVLRPDLTTLRWVPWLPGTAMCLADLESPDGTSIAVSPRQGLKRQLARLAERGWRALAGTELEFMVFRDTYEQAWEKGYRGLTHANLYNVDYSLLGTARVEPLLRRLRLDMEGAGLQPESAKGECNLGQHEIAFRYADALTTADNHAIYKNGAKEIASELGMSLTFMAKFDEREGNSCHVHLSLRDSSGAPVFAGGPVEGEAAPAPADAAASVAGASSSVPGTSRIFEQFLAGQLATLREMTLLFAPNVNSYKRYVPGSFAPTGVAWGWDNRTCALRAIGRGGSLRVENRVPGGDVNPYLALAAMIAGGLHGIENELTLEPALEGNGYSAAGLPRVPSTLAEAAELFEKSSIARHALGEEVVEHYSNMARVELAAYATAVTDWEKFRGFERL